MSGKDPEWRKYEQAVFEYLQLSHLDAEVTHDATIPGLLSEASRQIDVLVRETLAGSVFTTAFEAKCYKRRVTVKHVEEAIGLFRDVGVDRGVMITTCGYSESALRRALSDDVEVELDILNLAELGQFQSDGGALPYAGDHGVIIPAPLGWVIDGSKFPGTPARLFRRGLTFEQAGQEGEFMYVNFWSNDEIASTISELTALQDGNLKSVFPEVQITHEPLHLGGRWKGAMRTARDAYDHLEITAYVEFEEFIFFAVLHTPELVVNRNIRKLKYVVCKALPFTVQRDG